MVELVVETQEQNKWWKASTWPLVASADGYATASDVALPDGAVRLVVREKERLLAEDETRPGTWIHVERLVYADVFEVL